MMGSLGVFLAFIATWAAMFIAPTAAVWFVLWEFWLPLAGHGSRLWFVLSGLIVALAVFGQNDQ